MLFQVYHDAFLSVYLFVRHSFSIGGSESKFCEEVGSPMFCHNNLHSKKCNHYTVPSAPLGLN